MIKLLLPVGIVLSLSLPGAGQTMREPRDFFRQQIGLSDAQITAIESGETVVETLPTESKAEVFVFGATYVKAEPEDYFEFALDMARLRSLPSYLGARRFSNPPTLSDLEGFTLEPEDIANLERCKPGQCDVQLSAEAMARLQKSVDWSAPDVAEQVNKRLREMALELLADYQERGNSTLYDYQDKSRAFDLDGSFQSLLGRSAMLPVYLPELKHYLVDYPASMLPHVESFFYWEKVDFGLKPTLRLNQVIAYPSTGPRGPANVVVVKQLWASHYLQLALDLTASVPDGGRDGEKGFYLISLKGSRQEGLTGLMGAFRRFGLVKKARATQENILVYLKKALEERQ